MKKINFNWFFCCLFVLALGSCRQGTVSTAAFYDMTPAFQSSDASGKDLFRAYAKGQNENECRNNAKIEVMKLLVYDGVRQGTSILPILSDPAQVNKFRNEEQSFFRRQLNNEQLVSVEKVIRKDDKLRQSKDKDALYSMQVIIGINRRQFEKEVLNAVK